MYKDIDQQRFNWHIWGLTALGFFANFYNLYSMKAVLPSVAFSNWKSDDIGKNEPKINISILAGSIIGQLLFGYLANRNGWLKLYGYYIIALMPMSVLLRAPLDMIRCQ